VADALDTVLKPFRGIFEWVLAMLASVNVVLPAFAIQLVLGCLLGLAVWYIWSSGHLRSAKAPARLLATFLCGVFSIVLVAILADWGGQLLFPMDPMLEGTVNFNLTGANREQCLLKTHVELVDFRDSRVSSSSGEPDSQTGRFDLAFRPEFSNPPRALLVLSPCCDTIRVLVTPGQLRSRQPITINVIATSRP